MKKNYFLSLAAVILIGWTGIGIAQQGKVPPELWEKAKTKGVVRVLVQLNVPWQPEGKLTKDAALAQRKAITAAQDELLAELAGTKHKGTGRPRFTPSIGLEVGPDTLAVLERSARVIRVTEVRVGKPSLQESVPLVEADQAWAAGFDGTGWVVAVLQNVPGSPRLSRNSRKPDPIP